MKQDKENPTVIIELTEEQTNSIKNWSGCVFANVIVAAYKEDSEPSKKTLPIKLESNQIQIIEKSFSDDRLTGKRIMVYPPRDEEMEEKPVRAVLEKDVPLPPPPPPPKNTSPVKIPDHDSYYSDCDSHYLDSGCCGDF